MVVKIIDLGMHPFADTFISDKQRYLSEPTYPLECYLDENSGLVCLGCSTNTHDRYNLYDYSYTSSNSKFARKHWDNFATHVAEKLNLNDKTRIAEIGANDGYLLEQFKRGGFEVLGIDASRYMVNIANNKNLSMYCGIFNEESSEDITSKHGRFDLVVANNVFNHSNDPVDFVKGVTKLLTPSGVFVFEVPYWLNTIKDERFDQIYHEHVTYFTVKSSFELLKNHGLEIFDVEIVDYHGGSIRIFSRLKENEVKMNDIVKKNIENENELGLFNRKTYASFMTSITDKRNNFLKKIYEIKSQGHPIIGVGAAAKANTFLNFYNLDASILEYITDASEHKQGKYTPLTRIPIVGDEIFEKYDKVYALILSWNISAGLKAKLKEINKNIQFLEISDCG